MQYKDFVNYLNEFKKKLPENKRDIFIDRYWYLEDLKEISKKNKTKVNNIKVILYRLRENLKDYLTERGVDI